MRKRQRNRLLIIGLGLAALAVTTGCAPAHFNAAPQLQDRVRSIKTVAIMPPNIKVYQVGVTGTPQVIEEETAAAKQVVSTAIGREFGRHTGVVFTSFPTPPPGFDASLDPEAARLAAELKDTQALFEVVGNSINLHALAASPKTMRFAEKLTNLDYSLGPDVQHFAKLANADALVFTSGADLRTSGSRKTLTGLGSILLALPTFGESLRALFALGGNTILNVALVDATTGDILWYNVGFHPQSWVRLTNPKWVTYLTAPVLRDFPLGTTPPPCEYDEGGAWSCPPASTRPLW